MAISSTAAITPAGNGWRARLQLDFERQHERTVLARRQHYGPLAVQRPFYPEPDGGCHVYLLHPPGGIVGGDHLSIEVNAASGSQCLLTTPGAGKIYRNTGEFARIDQRLVVAGNALLEWLPQETIVFSSSHSVTTIDIELSDGAGFCGWDIVCLGRPASGETFDNGVYRQRIRLWREGLPLCIEHNHFIGDSESLSAPWGLDAFTVVGTLLCAVDDIDSVRAVREAIGFADDCRFSITQMRGVIVARYLGHSAEQAKKLFTDAWSVLRPRVFQREVVRPRVWDT